MSDSVRPQRRQPTRLPRPWDSPGKNTGVGCQSWKSPNTYPQGVVVVVVVVVLIFFLFFPSDILRAKNEDSLS